MSAAYRVGLVPALPCIPCDLAGARWSLVALDPSTPVRSGGFVASAGDIVPYRLWPAPKPRALVLLLHGALDYSGAFDELGPFYTPSTAIRLLGDPMVLRSIRPAALLGLFNLARTAVEKVFPNAPHLLLHWKDNKQVTQQLLEWIDASWQKDLVVSGRNDSVGRGRIPEERCLLPLTQHEREA